MTDRSDLAFEAARKLQPHERALSDALTVAARKTGTVSENEARALAERLISILQLFAQGEDPEEEAARRLVEAQEQTARANERARELLQSNEALKRSETQSQHRAEQLALLAGVMKRVAGILDPERLMQKAADMIRAERNHTFVAIVVLDNEGVLVGRWAGREGVARRASGRTQGPARGVIGRALSRRAPQVVPDVAQDPDYHADVPGTRSEMVVPLLDEGEPVGVIDFQSEKEAAFDLDAVVAGEAIAEFLVVALRNARLVAQMRGWS
jgi:GAF domain-containing protein